uniref:Uncharacterized protein n=1 Tax=Timema shepardi TaxID=629360 RepID=A0A7R9FXF7_TIMSH|nr:unnamed protein product [Timema shepardi]
MEFVPASPTRLPVVSECAPQTARVSSNHSSMSVPRVPSPPPPEVNTPVAENWCYTQVPQTLWSALDGLWGIGYRQASLDGLWGIGYRQASLGLWGLGTGKLLLTGCGDWVPASFPWAVGIGYWRHQGKASELHTSALDCPTVTRDFLILNLNAIRSPRFIRN